jgi:hypothetical protein
MLGLTDFVHSRGGGLPKESEDKGMGPEMKGEFNFEFFFDRTCLFK